MNHRPRKRFGQNFLHNPVTIEQIVTLFDPQPNQHVLEIGPGKGALTRKLATRCGRLDLVEIDRDLYDELQKIFGGQNNVRLHNTDILKLDIASLVDDNNTLRVIGNIPYNITTPIIFHLTDYFAMISDIQLMMQKEVADRITALPGNKTYGRLSVILQLLYRVDKLMQISPGAFFPAPKVHSSLLRMTPKAAEQRYPADISRLKKILNAAFSQRRKTLRNSLKALLSEDDFINAGIDPGLRAENISVEQFAGLSLIAAP